MLVQEMDITADLGRVKEIWLNGAKNAHAPYVREDFWDQQVPEFVKEVENAGERYVCKGEASQIRGFLLAWPRVNRGCYVAELYVDEPFQKQGIATALFDTLKGENPSFPWLKGRYDLFTSSAYAHNSRSIAWHIKNKFRIRGVMFCPHTGLPKLEMMWRRDKVGD